MFANEYTSVIFALNSAKSVSYQCHLYFQKVLGSLATELYSLNSWNIKQCTVIL